MTTDKADVLEDTERRFYNLRQQGREADVYIYGAITSFPRNACGEMSAYNLVQEIAGLDVDTINVCINSSGGSVSEGLAIYSALCRHPAKVITHCDGFACSVASVIFMAGDERLISDVGLMMIHEASCVAGGNAAQLQKVAEDLTKMTETAAKAYQSRVNISEEELAKMLAAETWLTPREAVAMGFATGIENRNTGDTVAMNGQARIAELIKLGLAKEVAAAKNQGEQIAAEETPVIEHLVEGVHELLAVPKPTPAPALEVTRYASPKAATEIKLFNFAKKEEE